MEQASHFNQRVEEILCAYKSLQSLDHLIQLLSSGDSVQEPIPVRYLAALSACAKGKIQSQCQTYKDK
eukprot:2440202-Amphidinium_carterae.1